MVKSEGCGEEMVRETLELALYTPIVLGLGSRWAPLGLLRDAVLVSGADTGGGMTRRPLAELPTLEPTDNSPVAKYATAVIPYRWLFGSGSSSSFRYAGRVGESRNACASSAGVSPQPHTLRSHNTSAGISLSGSMARVGML